VWNTYQVVQSTISDVFVTPVVPTAQDPSRPDATPAFPNWDKKERVNILLMGLDTRPDEIPRSDTMILFSIDPATKTAAMLSIPRDLWVNIPGYGENRINAAYPLGEADKVPGGGAQLAKETVSANFGIPVHYFATIDLAGFEALVNSVGGVTISVDQPLRDDEYPTPTYGYVKVYIPAGLQHMDGKTALRWARSRHGDNDFGRSQRQQMVLMAIRAQAMRFDIITKFNDVMVALRGTIKTDLSFTQAGSLAMLSRDIRPENIQRAAVDANYVTPFVTAEGADVLRPNWDAINQLLTRLFGATAEPGIADANVVVQNGTFVNGLAAQYSADLKNKGFNVIGTEQAPDAGNYAKTVIYDYTGKKKVVDALVEALGVDQSAVQKPAQERVGVDVVVVLGSDKAPAEETTTETTTAQ
jgi:polyisoprenyl-teichoic acid--peptidoglycan teichoic acid transferase